MYNNKIWYISGSIAFIALVVLIIGLLGLPKNEMKTFLDAKGARAGSQEQNEGEIGAKDPLVLAADTFSDRFRPKPVVAPPIPQPKPKPEAKPVEIEYGTVKVDIEPIEELPTAQWQLNGKWYDSGQQSEPIIVGRHNITFTAVDGWDSPTTLAAIVKKDETSELKANYNKILFGQAKVNIAQLDDLDGPQWKIGNSQWYDSQQLAENIRVGNYKITFKPIPGWILPDTLDVNIKHNELTEINASYIKPKPADPTFRLTTTLAMSNGRGEAWFKAVNNNEELHFRTGEKVDKFVLDRVYDGYVILTQDGFEYKLEVPVVKDAAATAKPPVPQIASPPIRQPITR